MECHTQRKLQKYWTAAELPHRSAFENWMQRLEISDSYHVQWILLTTALIKHGQAPGRGEKDYCISTRASWLLSRSIKYRWHQGIVCPSFFPIECRTVCVHFGYCSFSIMFGFWLGTTVALCMASLPCKKCTASLFGRVLGSFLCFECNFFAALLSVLALSDQWVQAEI